MKKMMSTLLLSTLVLGSLNTAVFAEEGITTNETSEGKVHFVVDDEATNPPVSPPIVDPTDPENPDPTTPEITPDEPDKETGQTGPLTIDFVSTLNFGIQKISNSDETYPAFASKSTITGSDVKVINPNYVQITDNTGSLAGWTLKVEQTQAFKDEAEHELEGAKINVSNGAVNSASDTTGIEAKEAFAIEPSTEEKAISVEVMTASEGHGAGQFFYLAGNGGTAVTEELGETRGTLVKADVLGEDGQVSGQDWFNTAVQLEVPGASVKKSTAYTAELTWTLTNQPANEA
ncbi:WxL domain-containing protein [Vagococcus xieshaowenii]|nr:WxL domain-containing protein [Vagococcus xieshaowenii]